jgi:hypothetical protein
MMMMMMMMMMMIIIIITAIIVIITLQYIIIIIIILSYTVASSGEVDIEDLLQGLEPSGNSVKDSVNATSSTPKHAHKASSTPKHPHTPKPFPDTRSKSLNSSPHSQAGPQTPGGGGGGGGGRAGGRGGGKPSLNSSPHSQASQPSLHAGPQTPGGPGGAAAGGMPVASHAKARGGEGNDAQAKTCSVMAASPRSPGTKSEWKASGSKRCDGLGFRV